MRHLVRRRSGGIEMQANQRQKAEEVAADDPRLDFSVESLAVVDAAVRAPSFDGRVDLLAAYVGEVVIRAAGGSWWPDPQLGPRHLVVGWDFMGARPLPWRRRGYNIIDPTQLIEFTHANPEVADPLVPALRGALAFIRNRSPARAERSGLWRRWRRPK